MKKALILCLMMSVLFCACESKEISQDFPEDSGNPEEIMETESETPAWMSQDYETAPPPAETVVPASTEIDEGATALDAFTYEVFASGTAMITDFTGSETDLIITSHIGEYPVTEIGHYAFEASWDVTSVTLPETITVIHEQAFADCESLTEINIPEGVTSLERGVFSNCMSLTELTIPESVTETEEELLTGCSLKDLYILNAGLAYQNWGLEDAEEKCTIHAPEGSVILAWAEENGFPTEIIY